MRWSLGFVLVAALSVVGCRREDASNKVPTNEAPSNKAPSKSGAKATADLAAARQGFVTKLHTSGPAPQEAVREPAAPNFKEVEYSSGDLKLKGWLSQKLKRNEGEKSPAVVFLHGGWALSYEDAADTQPFLLEDFEVFMPMLRGENGNPGTYECFLGEVDDAIAAGRYVATLPYVDPDRIYVAGHSVGGVLTCLVSMMPSPYRGAASLDGYVDMEVWAKGSPRTHVPFNPRNAEEVRLRNPLAFAESIRCPLRLYCGDDTRKVNAPLAAKAKQAGKDCELVAVPGDHHEMVDPAIDQAIVWFKELGAK